MTLAQLLVPTFKDVIGCVFLISLLINTKVRNAVPKGAAVMVILFWFCFCYPLAKTEYKLEKYLYAENNEHRYENIEDKLYMWTKENGIKIAVSFENDPNTYYYFYSDVQEDFEKTDNQSFRYHRMSRHRDMETVCLTHRVLSWDQKR